MEVQCEGEQVSGESTQQQSTYWDTRGAFYSEEMYCNLYNQSIHMEGLRALATYVAEDGFVGH